jgi:ribose-phosphate pyrophosphokinase
MITLRRHHVKIRRFPDSQTHAIVAGVNEGEDIRLVWRVRTNDELIELLQVSNALDGLFAKKRELVIPYLLGARSDRRMEPGGSVDLRVIADCINGCRFERVTLFDVHSDVALQLIDRSVNIGNDVLVRRYDEDYPVRICPDAGAAKKHYEAFRDVVFCAKTRDLSTGRISLKVLEPEKCTDRHCVIVDDLCDGGATFLAIAEQISPSTLTLIVSHGIFSKGFTELRKHFDRIITSDSYCSDLESDEFVHVVPLNL